MISKEKWPLSFLYPEMNYNSQEDKNLGIQSELVEKKKKKLSFLLPNKMESVILPRKVSGTEALLSVSLVLWSFNKLS